MTDEVHKLPSSLREDPPEVSPARNGSPNHMEDLRTDANYTLEKEVSVMTQDALDRLRENYSFPAGVQIRIPEEGETILSISPGEVTFYEAAFPTGLRFQIYPTI